MKTTLVLPLLLLAASGARLPAIAQAPPAAQLELAVTHRTVPVGKGMSLHCAVAGQGPPVLLLHGFLKTWRSWRHVMPGLAKSYTLIVPDLPGLGESSRAAAGYDGRSVADALHALVKELGYRQVAVVGHDVGGWMAYAYAAAYREEVSRLVIVDVTLPGIGLEKAMDVASGGSWHFGFNMLPELPEKLIKGREKVYISWFARHHFWVKGAITEADIDTFTRAYQAPGALHACLEYHRALPESARQNRQSARQKLPMSVLAVGAGHMLKGENFQDLQRVATHVRGVMVEDSGHYIPEEQPQKLARHLATFLGETP